MKALKTIIGLAIPVVLAACSSTPAPFGLSDAGTDDTATTESTDTATDTGTATDTTTESDPGTETDTTDPDTGTDTNTGGSTDTGQNECPWECVPSSGATTCSAVFGEHWIHNTNYTCAVKGELCCQAVGAPGGLAESCADKLAFSCKSSCTGKLVLNSDYYCDNANQVCCEDPAGPIPGCINAGGSCVSELLNCPAGTSKSDLNCTFGYKCCLPPVCPWSCEPNIGATSCTTKTVNPDFVRNFEYSCEGVDEVCCQPLGGDGLGELCSGEVTLTCKESCEGIEQHNTDLYCKKANQRCCEDPRPYCQDIGGQCNLSLIGCQDGWEKNDRGICTDSSRVCCTEAGPWNTCADEGGTCVEIGKTCPLTPIPTLPDFTNFCGLDIEFCCMPVL